MKFSAKLLPLLTLTIVSFAAMAAPGNPIGGIIVKGGKNPGGQMLVLATTDSKGGFNIKFAEGGDYKLEFVGQSRKTLPDARAEDVQLDYVVRANAETADSARKVGAVANSTARFGSDLNHAELLLKVPKGGADITGVLQVSSAAGASASAERAINESGVSVKSSKPKGSK
jgi:hypothetical protein